METALKLLSAAATVEGPLPGETGHGLLHLPDDAVFAIAGDATGAPSGDVAVRILIEALRIAFRPKDGTSPAASVEGKARLIRNAIRAAGETIAAMPSEKRSGGATVAVLAFDEGDSSRATVLNVGDCRVYRFRSGRAERLTRAASAEETAAEAPLLMDAFNNAVGRDEIVDVEEQYVQVESGDTFALLPGTLFKTKAEQAVGRSLRRTSHGAVADMAAAVVEDALKNESAAGVALVVHAEETEVAAPPEEAPDAPEVGMPPPEKGDVEIPAPMPSSEPKPDDTVVDYRDEDDDQGDDERFSKRSTQKIVTDEAAATAEPVRDGNLPKPSRPTVQISSAPKPSSPPKPPSPLARSPLLSSDDEMARRPSPWPVFAAILAGMVIVVGLGWLGIHLWRQHKAAARDAELQQSANVADLVAQTTLNGKWGVFEKSLSKMAPMPADEDAVVREWIALWHQADDAGLSDAAARSRLTVLDMLVAQAGGSTAQEKPVWSADNRADIFCRLVFEKQQQLAAAAEQTLQAMNRRSDIPFADRATQEATLSGIGQFTRNRAAQQLDSIRGAFTTARISEGQLESWINRGEAGRPQDELALQKIPGEPLRQLSSSLDRAWDGIFQIVTATATDTAHWRKQRAAASLLPRLNRLDAVRQNILAERKKFTDVRRWRTATQNKQLIVWMLGETAALGAQLNKPAAPAVAPAAPSRRR